MTKYHKSAILFSRRPSATIARAVVCLRSRGYDVPLLVCSAGMKPWVKTDANAKLGALVGDVFDDLEDPPAILCVNNTRTLERIYVSMDVDLAIVYAFSYQITEKMLNCRAPFVNYHPAPLPRMSGPLPYPHLIVDPSIELTATWHYMAAEIDKGPIIHTHEMSLPSGIDRDTATPKDLVDAAERCFFDTFETCLDLVEKGEPGRPQEKSVKSGYGASYFSDQERTISNDMTVKEVLTLGRALHGMPLKPLLKYDDNLFYAIEITECVSESNDVGSQTRKGMNVVQVFKDGALQIKLRKI